MSEKVRVLIVEDSPTYQKILSSILNRSTQYQLIDVAGDGEAGILAVNRQKPDLILLDLEMPKMDGFTFLRWLMANRPVPVIVVSSKADVHHTFKALELGAADFQVKPASSSETRAFEAELLRRMEVISKVTVQKLVARADLFRSVRSDLLATPGVSAPETLRAVRSGGRIEAVVIGASTGGPTAIFSIIPNLPREFPVPIAVAQHMPGGFTRSFAERMNKLSKLQVSEARGGESFEPGHVFIAPGGHHLLLEKQGGKVRTRVETKEEEDRYTPSVDRLMISAAEIYKERTLGVVLTGMGNDGVIGMKRIMKSGGITFAESEETAVVFGMPRESIACGVVEAVIPLPRMHSEIMKCCL